MSLLDDMTSMLSRYASGAAPAADVDSHFQHVAQSVDSTTMAQGIAEAMRSDQTPPFAQIVSQLFASGSNDQKTAMLTTLLSAVGPEKQSELAALIPGLAGAASGSSVAASALTPEDVQSLAQHVEQHDGSIVDKMSALYAAHPTLVKTLGTAAMMIAMRKIAEQRA